MSLPESSNLHHPSVHLAVAPHALGVVDLPSVTATGLGVVVAVTLVHATGLLAGRGEATALAVLRNTII
jgi:hypothetical protein